MSTTVLTPVRPSPLPEPARPVVDIVLPVYNEMHVLEQSVRRIRDYCATNLPYTWRITIVDNASTDDTWAQAGALSALFDDVRAVHLDRKGRGLALREAWTDNDAAVVAYMDIDLSTGLDALAPMVAPLVSGHSDVAIGSRLARGAMVARGPKRELISRSYNLLLRSVFAARFHDAQCGFKAVRRDVAEHLVPAIEDDAWFFDTELLLLAEHNGLRIHEVPVDWTDDPDSRVRIAATARDDLRGVARMAWRFLRGRGRIELGSAARRQPTDDFGRRFVSFGIIGAISTLVSMALFLAMRGSLGAMSANVVALTSTALGNTWANRRYTFARRGADHRLRHYAVGLGAFAGGLGLSTLALAGVAAAKGGAIAQVAALIVTWTVSTIVRFSMMQAATKPPTSASIPGPTSLTSSSRPS